MFIVLLGWSQALPQRATRGRRGRRRRGAPAAALRDAAAAAADHPGHPAVPDDRLPEGLRHHLRHHRRRPADDDRIGPGPRLPDRLQAAGHEPVDDDDGHLRGHRAGHRRWSTSGFGATAGGRTNERAVLARSPDAPPASATGVAYAIAIGAMVLTLFPLYWLFVDLDEESRGTHSRRRPTSSTSRTSASTSRSGARRDFGQAFVNSVIVVILGVALALVIATPAAYAIVRFRVRGGRLAQAVAATRLRHPRVPVRHPDVRAVPADRAVRHPDRPGAHLPGVRGAVRGVAHPVVLHRGAARTSGTPPGSTAARSSSRCCGSTCRSPRPGIAATASWSASTCGTR